ncbi:transglutaminase-like domain-containing protein [Desulfomonile tiedjei]|uniref:transglutaminase-like domain-containing protein n=1 Tax=Desulfomonile tiedjei TaxID=2358 RepID=UPI0012F9F0EA|nr:transglutaminase domain-containing protein [Desulfomonile tiedjei]
MSLPCKADSVSIDWIKAAKLHPDLKVLVLIETRQPFTLADLATCADFGLIPADRDPGLIVGLERAVFKSTLQKWMAAQLPEHLKGRLLSRFTMTGIYRLGFKVEAKGYDGPLTLQVTGPRDGPGQKLLKSEHAVRPGTAAWSAEDLAGNRWLTVNYSRVRQGGIVKIYFAFKYLVDVGLVLKHDLLLKSALASGQVPSEIAIYLKKGHKIDPELPEAIAWASGRGNAPPDARNEFKHLYGLLTGSIKYDNRKKTDYFGGLSVYSNLDDMYQNARDTLRKGTGCCPDTVLLECAFLRARGIPCRTAGRFGHFFSEVYVPGNGWLSTSVTPTGIPLLISPGPDNVPYQKWEPAIPLRTTILEARIRIEPLEENQ